MAGDIAAFLCQPRKTVPPTLVTWSKNSVPINAENRFYISNVTGTLFIREVTAGDNGVYSCTASNDVGRVSGPMVTLKVVTSFMKDHNLGKLLQTHVM